MDSMPEAESGFGAGTALTDSNVNDIYIRSLTQSFPLELTREPAMSLAPLLDAAPAIPVHAFAAMAAFALGVVQLAAPKGTLPHRTFGWIWVVLMAVVAISSFWIHELRVIGPWSPIHLLSIITLAMLVRGVWFARNHNVRRHRLTMTITFAGALVIAGLFTFLPGRIMHAVVFGH
jgi:uncharacterized membrane protein